MSLSASTRITEQPASRATIAAGSPVAPAPIGPREADALLRELRAFRLLEGYRGLPAADLNRLCEIVARASEFIADQRDLVGEFDINPLICTGSNITAVDALIVRAAPG